MIHRLRNEPGIAATSDSGEGWVAIDLTIEVTWPCQVAKVADDAAAAVSRRVRELTGLDVDTVDITVEIVKPASQARVE